jgi:hypothetical protein
MGTTIDARGRACPQPVPGPEARCKIAETLWNAGRVVSL